MKLFLYTGNSLQLLFLLVTIFFSKCTTLVNAQKSYKLNITVRGLDGDRITIKEIRSRQKLKSISNDGYYSFADPIDDGDKFSLKITNQPNEPNQECTIENGKGKMTAKWFENKKIVVTCRTPINHVVIVGIDGMGGAYVRDEDSLNVRTPDLPVLKALESESSWTHLAQDALPTSSSTNWCSMLGGNPPDVHGVLSNSWQVGDSIIPPTLFKVTRDAYPTSRIGLLYDWSGLGRLIEDDVADTKYSPGDAAETLDAAIKYITTERPLLTFVHLDLCDYAGHGYGWGSEEYVASLESADSMVGSIIDTLKNEGMWNNTALLISSDHGGEGTSHGDDTYLERTIPFIVKTPQSVGYEIKREVRIWDIAATAATLLGLEHPEYWVSTPAYEAVPFSPEWDSMATSNIYYKEVNEFQQVYNTTGTIMNNELSIVRPIVPSGYLSLGDIAIPSESGQVCKSNETSCSCLDDNTDYRGTIATTITGKFCQKWTEQVPHGHTRTPENYPNAGLGDHNYCRNPDGEPGGWCYTTDPNSRWELCHIPSCPTYLNVTTVVVEKNHPSIANPVGYELIYSSEGTPDDKNLTLWNPIAPPGGYSCPGQVAKTDYDGMPSLSDVGCILESYLRKNDLSGSTFVWNDSGSKATFDGSIWQCEADKSIANQILDPGLFVSRRVFNDPGNNDCRVLKGGKFDMCEDDKDFRFKDVEVQDCEWVGKDAVTRCTKKWKKKQVRDFCPVTCGKC